jgi:DNA-binding winged helix-turn-helix (wHTH) protein
MKDGLPRTAEFLGVFARFRLHLNDEDLYRLDQASGETLVRLGRPAFRMLCLLREREGKPVSNKELKAAGWPEKAEKRDGELDDNLRVEIGNLRASLGENARNSCIQWRRGHGYRYVAPATPPPPPSGPEPPGLRPEQLQELINAAVTGAIGPFGDRVDDLTNRLGVTHGAVLTMLRDIGEADIPLERLPQKLAEVGEQYRSAMDRLAALDPQDPVTRDLRERAEAAMKAGQFDEADQLGK